MGEGLSVKYRVTLVCCGCVVLSHWDSGGELELIPVYKSRQMTSEAWGGIQCLTHTHMCETQNMHWSLCIKKYTFAYTLAPMQPTHIHTYSDFFSQIFTGYQQNLLSGLLTW